MATKIIENENGEVITKTSKRVKKDRKLRKFQKVAGVTTMTAAMIAMSHLSALHILSSVAVFTFLLCRIRSSVPLLMPCSLISEYVEMS